MRRRAFTMVELLAATALSTLLFITAISVIRSLSGINLGSRETAPGWTLAARQQLEWDLNNAVVMRQDDHGLVLGGYGSLDSQSFASTHLPVMVIYSLRDINSRLWLVREQTSLDPLTPDLNFSELVCGDIKSFSVTGSYAPRTLPAESQTAQDDDPTPVLFQQLSGMQRVPDRVRVRIDLRSGQMPVMDTIVYVR